MTIHYVCGFMFDKEGMNLALIEKQRGPKHNIGKWNGIGGKIEGGETPIAAMFREFNEEAGIEHTEWKDFLTLQVGEPWDVTAHITFFRCFSDKVFGVQSMETEEVRVWGYGVQMSGLTVPNLEWIIPMAKDRNLYSVEAMGVYG